MAPRVLPAPLKAAAGILVVGVIGAAIPVRTGRADLRLTHGVNAARVAAPPMGHASGGRCDPHWDLVPDMGMGTSFFTGVAAASAREVWAVGASGVDTAAQPMAARWDGGRWRTVDGPVLPGERQQTFQLYADGAAFTAVVAPGAGDLWAAGSEPTAAGRRLFMAHRVGGRWRLARMPDPGPDAVVRAMAAASPRDIWAVGDVGGTRALIAHWDGRAWRITPPAPGVAGRDVRLSGVVALSASDAWAVGTRGSAADSTRRALVEHWDGARWRAMAIPQPGVVDDALDGVAASGGEVWAVGSAEGTDYESVPLVERWAGMVWRVMPSPPLPPAQGSLDAVAVRSPRDVWAVGGGTFARWTSARWQARTLSTNTAAVTSAASAALASAPAIIALTVAPSDGLWAAGRTVVQTDQQYTALVARYDPSPCGTRR